MSSKRPVPISHPVFWQVSNGGDHPDSDVEDVKKFGRVIPVFLSAVGFFAVYSQVSLHTNRYSSRS